jgi:hypothetical protein
VYWAVIFDTVAEQSISIHLNMKLGIGFWQRQDFCIHCHNHGYSHVFVTESCGISLNVTSILIQFVQCCVEGLFDSV